MRKPSLMPIVDAQEAARRRESDRGQYPPCMGGLLKCGRYDRGECILPGVRDAGTLQR